MKKIILTGNVGRDPEMRSDQEGNQFASFSVGVSVGTKQNPKTDWIDVSCNGKLADTVRTYVKKGSKLLIEGFPSANAYINKENKAVATLRVYANTIEFIGSKREDSTADDYSTSPVYALPESGNAKSNAAIDLQADDIPF